MVLLDNALSSVSVLVCLLDDSEDCFNSRVGDGGGFACTALSSSTNEQGNHPDRASMTPNHQSPV